MVERLKIPMIATIVFVPLLMACTKGPETTRVGGLVFRYRSPDGWRAQAIESGLEFTRGPLRFLVTDLGPHSGEFESWCRSQLMLHLDHDEDRTIANQRSMTFAGYRGFAISTWNRADHGDPRRYVFVSYGTSVLVACSTQECASECLEAMDSFFTSLMVKVSRLSARLSPVENMRSLV